MADQLQSTPSISSSATLDELWMEEALRCAQRAQEMGEIPVGAVVVCEECELFVTIEPCAMCSGALVHARIKRLVYGSDDPKAGAVHSVMQVVNHPELNHRMEVQRGVLAGRSAEMLQTFFRNRR